MAPGVRAPLSGTLAKEPNFRIEEESLEERNVAAFSLFSLILRKQRHMLYPVRLQWAKKVGVPPFALYNRAAAFPGPSENNVLSNQRCIDSPTKKN